MKVINNKRWNFKTGYQYVNLASDGKTWKVSNGLVQPGYGSNRSITIYSSHEAAVKDYKHWLDYYTKCNTKT